VERKKGNVKRKEEKGKCEVKRVKLMRKVQKKAIQECI
jgi:hypothetical protein